MDGAAQEYWLFGYGSLMWRPGFAFVERRPARLHGFHRSLCVLSHVHRGTPECPGLVLGLDTGGSCHGMAFRVEPKLWPETLAYLRGREQVTMVYRELTHPIRLLGDARRVLAVTYVVDRRHLQYSGRLPAEAQLRYVLQGSGQSGLCRDYLRATVEHLRAMGIRDEGLERLLAMLTENEPISRPNSDRTAPATV